MKKRNYWLLAAGLLGAIGVGMGAFGAHALAPYLQQTGRTATYETAVTYHMTHTLALFGIAVWYQLQPDERGLKGIAISFIIGTLIFSGSLYLLVLTNTPWLGAITPIGGVAFIVGWLLLAWKGTKKALP